MEASQQARAPAATEMGPGGVTKGAKTEEYLRVFDIPDRFNNPGACYLPGNPVFSCNRTMDAPEPEPIRDEWFQGYAQKKQHPMYRTTANNYGGQQPSVFDMPSTYHCKVNKFSDHLGKSGMYQNCSLNTELDKSKV